MRDIHQVAHNVNIISTSLCVVHSVIAFIEKLLCVGMQTSVQQVYKDTMNVLIAMLYTQQRL